MSHGTWRKLERRARWVAAIAVAAIGFGMFPWLNPTQYRFIFGADSWPFSAVSLLLAIPILAFAVRLTNEAEALKQKETKAPQPE